MNKKYKYKVLNNDSAIPTPTEDQWPFIPDLVSHRLSELNKKFHFGILTADDFGSLQLEIESTYEYIENQIDEKISSSYKIEVLSFLIEMEGVLYTRLDESTEAKKKWLEAGKMLVGSVDQMAFDLFLFFLTQQAKFEKRHGIKNLRHFWYWRLVRHVDSVLRNGLTYTNNLSFYIDASIGTIQYGVYQTNIERKSIQQLAREIAQNVASRLKSTSGRLSQTVLSAQDIEDRTRNWLFHIWYEYLQGLYETKGKLSVKKQRRIEAWEGFLGCFRSPVVNMSITFAISNEARIYDPLVEICNDIDRIFSELYPSATKPGSFAYVPPKKDRRADFDRVLDMLQKRDYGFLNHLVDHYVPPWDDVRVLGDVLINVSQDKKELIYHEVFDCIDTSFKESKHVQPVAWEALKQMIQACEPIHYTWSDEILKRTIAIPTQHDSEEMIDEFFVTKLAEVFFSTIEHERAMKLLRSDAGINFTTLLRNHSSRFMLVEVFDKAYSCKKRNFAQTMELYAWTREKKIFQEDRQMYMLHKLLRNNIFQPNETLDSVISVSNAHLTDDEKGSEEFKLFMIKTLLTLPDVSSQWSSARDICINKSIDITTLNPVRRIEVLAYLCPYRSDTEIFKVLKGLIDDLVVDENYDISSPFNLFFFLSSYKMFHTHEELLEYIKKVIIKISEEDRFLLNQHPINFVAKFLIEHDLAKEVGQLEKHFVSSEQKIAFFSALAKFTSEKSTNVQIFSDDDLHINYQNTLVHGIQNGQVDFRRLYKFFANIELLDEKYIHTLWEAIHFLCSTKHDELVGKERLPYEIQERSVPLPNVGIAFKNLLHAYYLFERAGEFQYAKELDRKLERFRKYSSLNIGPLTPDNMHFFVEQGVCADLQFGVDVRRCGAIAVVGKRGSGKSTLVNEFVLRQSRVSDAFVARIECLAYMDGQDFMSYLYAQILGRLLYTKRLTKSDTTLIQNRMDSLRYSVTNTDSEELSAEIQAGIPNIISFSLKPTAFSHSVSKTERDMQYIALMHELKDTLSMIKKYFSKVIIVMDEFDKMNNPKDKIMGREKYSFLQGLRNLIATDGVHFIVVGLDESFKFDEDNEEVEHSVFDTIITVHTDDKTLRNIMNRRITWLGMDDVFPDNVREKIIKSTNGSPRKLIRILSDLVAYWAKEHAYRLDEENITPFL